MNSNPSNEERIAILEKDLQSSKNKAQKYVQELETLRQQYADDLFTERQSIKSLHEERQQLQRDYSALRVQKGGFGLKVLMISGFGGF